MTSLIIPFHFVANDVALDLVNTLDIADAQARDLIATPAELAQWLEAADLMCPMEDWTKQDFAAFHRLRDVLAKVTNTAIDRTQANAQTLSVLNTHLLEHRSNFSLSKNAHGFQLSVRETLLNAAA